MYEPIWKIFRKLISFLVKLIISLFSNFFSSVRHLANHTELDVFLLCQIWWSETTEMKQIGENETPFVRLEENSNWKEALHLRFYYYLDLLQTNKHPIRSTCTRQSRNASRSFVNHPLIETQGWSVGSGERKRCEIFFKQGALPPMLEDVFVAPFL